MNEFSKIVDFIEKNVDEKPVLEYEDGIFKKH